MNTDSVPLFSLENFYRLLKFLARKYTTSGGIANFEEKLSNTTWSSVFLARKYTTSGGIAKFFFKI